MALSSELPASSKPFQLALGTLLVLCLSASSVLAYNLEKSITIDRTKISDPSCGTTLSNYPMLFSVTDPDLAHTTSGGNVTDLGGDDIIFVARDAATCGGPASCTLDHEIERYVNTTGELVAWVRIPAVNTALAASDTVIYINYGDSSVMSPTENPPGVWDASFKSVWHLEEVVVDEATGGVHVDSTSNGNNGAQDGNVESAGQVADGQDFDGVDDAIGIGNPGLTNAVTVSAWVKHNSLPAAIQDYIDLGNDVFIRHDGGNTVGQLDFAIRSGGTSYHFRNNGALTTGAWYHVAGTWDGTSLRLFKNGAEVLPALTPGITLGNVAGQFSISNGTETMDGTIDEVRVSDMARSACWIDADYDNQSDPGDIGAPGFYTVGTETGPYDFLKPITVDRAQIPGSCGATLANYPMLFSVTDPDLAHTSSGGQVTDLQGDDIIFRAHDAATCGGPSSCTLDHEIEKYVSTTGELVAWVRIPSVNTAAAASNSVIYVYYGNSTITSPTENPDGVWDANYAGVWHLAENGTGAVDEFVDSSGAGNHGQGGAGTANRVPTQITNGVIGNAQTFDNTDDNVRIPNSASLGITGDITVTGWVKRTNMDWLAILTKTNLSSRYDYQFLISVSDTLGLWADGASPTVINTTDTITDTTWHHLAVSKSGNNVTFFVDGVVAAGGGVQTGGMNNNPDPVVIGYDNESGSAIGGNLDELRLSSSARSSCWIAASYNNQIWPDKAVTPSPDPTPNPSTGFFTVGAATAVELVSFTARGLDGSVELEWETGSELDNLGFHLYRSSSSSGPWERLTASVMPGLGSSPAGARYRYVDTGVTNGETYYYELEDVETTGATKRHGPVWATPEAGLGDGSEGSSSSKEESDMSARLTYGDPEANAFRVRPRRNGVVLELETHGFVAVAQQDGSVRLEVAGLEEFFDSSLPVKRTWVQALGGKDVELVSVRGRELERFTGLSPSGSLEREVEATSRGSVRAHLRRGSRRQVAREGAKLLEVGYQGEVKKALVELSPFTWDGGALVLAKKLEVHVAFRGREARRVPRSSGGKASVRLVAKEGGLYGIALSEVLGARRASETHELRLSRQGESVAYHREAGMLYFWSEGSSANRYGNEAVYELEPGVAGERMEVVDEALGASSYYLETLDREENRYYQATLLDASDLWLWEVLIAPTRKSFGFEVRELSSEAVSSSLSVWLQGTSDVAGFEDHHVRLYVNGSLVGESRWDGKRAHAMKVELAPGVLREGENTLELESVLDTGAPYAMEMLDRFQVRYPRSVGVLEDSTYVLDLTERPRWVSVREGFEAERDYEGFDEALHPEVRAVARATLRKREHGADYLVIGPQAFLKEARPLLQHRKGQGLRVVTASTESIASEFGYGELTPQSVRELIAYAYHEWGAPKLRYVLLLGDGTYDYKDYLGTGKVNRVPPWVERTSYLWTASDPAYGAVNGEDLLPDVAVGRLPAQTLDELRAMVSKVLAYERGGLTLSGPHVLVADDADEAGNFEGDAEEIATTLLAGRETTRLYLSELGASRVSSGIVESFDAGASTMSYIGHGGIHLWADENVFNTSRVDLLTSQEQQPFLMTMNCLNGYFDFPYFDSLAEALLKAEGKGVIGAFSPSGLSLDAPAHRYHQALLKELLDGGHARLGDALLAAQTRYADTGSFPELLVIYHLFADPAMTLH